MMRIGRFYSLRGLFRRIVRFFSEPQSRRRLLRVTAAFLAVFLMLFCYYQFTALLHTEIQTMLVTEDRIEETVVGDAVLFREEVILPTTAEGLSTPLVRVGEHVAKDTPLVTMYTGGDALRESYLILERYIEMLEKAEREQDTLASLSRLKAELSALSLGTISALERGEAIVASETAEELRVLSCRIQALIDESFSLADLKTALRNEQNALKGRAGSAVETIAASQSGYYYPASDGYGSYCSLERLDALTGTELVSLLDGLKEGTAPTKEAPAGILLPSPEWFIAVSVDMTADELALLSLGGTYDVIFYGDGGERIPMTLERMIEGSSSAPAVIVLSTMRMPVGFSYDRLSSVHVVTGSIGGFSLPSSAVHMLDGYVGVYVLDGSIMYFRRIEILHDLGTRYLVKTRDPSPDGEYSENSYEYIALYDALILSGEKLFHGRVFS